MKTKLIAFLILFCACNKSLKEETPPQNVAAKSIAPKIHDNEIIITFKSGQMDDNAIHQVEGVVKEKIHTKTMEHFGALPFFVIHVPDVNKAVFALKNNPNVRSVSPNYIMSVPEPDFKSTASKNISLNSRLLSRTNNLFQIPTSNTNTIQLNAIKTQIDINKKQESPKAINRTLSVATYPDDTLFVAGAQWGLTNIKVPSVWPTNKGSQKVFIGSIDEGCDYGQPDICGQVDYHNSYDFYNHDSTVFDFQDEHGTATFSEYGANTDNGIGMAGVCPNLTGFIAKFLQQTGTTSAAIEAVDFITSLKVIKGFDVTVVNDSWGYQGDRIQELYDAFNRARSAGIIHSCAAGNAASDNDQIGFYPANFSTELDNVISVGAIDINDNPASFSNFGANHVNIYAPGVAIWCAGYQADGSPMWWNPSGTSMAAPHVTGACALYKAGHPNATYLEIRNAILSHARPVPALSGKCTTGGALDVSSFTQGSTDIPVNRTDCVLPPVDTTTPSKVQNVHVTGTTTSSISFAWDSSNHAYFYGIILKQSGLPDQLYSTFSTSINFVGFPTGHTATIIVYGVSKINKLSSPSDPCSGTTQGPTDTIPPTIPQNFRLVSMTQVNGLVNIVLGWDASTDNDQVLGYYGEGGDNRTGFNHWGFGYYIAYKYSNGDFVLGVEIDGLPANDTFTAHQQSIDRSGNRSAFCPDITFVTNGTVSPPPPSPPVINSFTANPARIDSGQTSTLSWSVSGTSSLSINGTDVTGLTSTLVSPPVNTDYTLIATNSAGSVTAQTSVTVNKPPPPPPPSADSVSVTLQGNVGLAGLHILTWTITGTPTTTELQESVNGVWVLRQSGGTSYTYTQKGKKQRTWRIVVSNSTNTAISNIVTLR